MKSIAGTGLLVAANREYIPFTSAVSNDNLIRGLMAYSLPANRVAALVACWKIDIREGNGLLLLCLSEARMRNVGSARWQWAAMALTVLALGLRHGCPNAPAPDSGDVALKQQNYPAAIAAANDVLSEHNT